MTDDIEKNWGVRTKLVRGGTKRSPNQETSEALYLTSGYAYDSAEEAWARFKGESPGFQYSRFGNPTVAMFEERMCLIEGAPAARATASGMAAVSAALLSYLRAGDHVVAAKALFGSCRYVVEEVLTRFGITTTLVDGTDLNQWQDAIGETTKAIFFETPSNPTLDIVDIAGVSAIAHKVGAKVFVDNVFATPIAQRPRELGADVVIYSATKHIDGQGRCLGGVILGDEDYINTHLQPFIRNTGPTISPFNAWVLLKSLETLDIRVREHCHNAERIAQFLERLPTVARVIYPTLKSHPQKALAAKQMGSLGGSIVGFEVTPTEGEPREAAFAVENALQLIDISNNLGDAKTLITHPATTTHQRLTPEARAELGISDALLRLSVGLEDAEDLMADLDEALIQI